MTKMTLPSSIDRNDMRNLVNHFPELLTSLKLSNLIIKELENYIDEGVEGICFLGMGGSSIVGSYVKALLSEHAGKQIVIVRDYILPAFITGDWVVIAVSYSGNTEETITSISRANTLGARAIILTSGGTLAKQSKHLQITLPAGIQPRAALPLMLSQALPVVQILVGLPISDFESLSKTIARKSLVWDKNVNSPRSLASVFMGQIPLFIGARHLIPVAYRAKCQINENSKALAFHSELPEANHNEIESFAFTHSCKIVPIFLRSAFESEVLSRRFDATHEIYKEMGLDVINLAIGGETKLEEMLCFTQFLDMVSVEYADLLGANPVSVEKITDLKQKLQKH